MIFFRLSMVTLKMRNGQGKSNYTGQGEELEEMDWELEASSPTPQERETHKKCRNIAKKKTCKVITFTR